MFRKKRILKGTGKSITESLTTKRIGQLNDAREKYGLNNVWSDDGKILYKVNNEVKVYYDWQLMAVNVYGKICYDWNSRFQGKLFFCFNLFVIFCSYFSEGFDSHVSLFCFFWIFVIAPLITCFDSQLKNIFKKFIPSLMYFSYSAFHIFLLFNFLSVISNLIAVNVLKVSCWQTIVWVLLIAAHKGGRNCRVRT